MRYDNQSVVNNVKSRQQMCNNIARKMNSTQQHSTMNICARLTQCDMGCFTQGTAGVPSTHSVTSIFFHYHCTAAIWRAREFICFNALTGTHAPASGGEGAKVTPSFNRIDYSVDTDVTDKQIIISCCCCCEHSRSGHSPHLISSK